MTFYSRQLTELSGKISENPHTFFQFRSLLALRFGFRASNPSVRDKKVDILLLFTYLTDKVFQIFFVRNITWPDTVSL